MSVAGSEMNPVLTKCVFLKMCSIVRTRNGKRLLELGKL